MIRVVQTGRNPTMRHLNRVHRISVAWLHEQLGNPGGKTACTKCNLFYEKSEEMAADIYTKAFSEPIKWEGVSRLINHWITGPVQGVGDGKPRIRTHIPGLVEQVQWFQSWLDEKGALHRFRTPPEPQPEPGGGDDSVWPTDETIQTNENTNNHIIVKTSSKAKITAAASWVTIKKPRINR